MAHEEAFTLVERSASSGPHHLFDNVKELTSGKTADHDFQYLAALREANEGMIVTCIPRNSADLVAFAAGGNATLELDTKTDSFASWRGYVRPSKREAKGQLGESIHFAKYHYKWAAEDFVLFTTDGMQYVLKERRDAEPAIGPSKVTDALIQAVGDWSISDEEVVWVYDRYWYQDKNLFREVKKASWDKVILDEDMKDELTSITKTFFSSKKVYEDLGVPWKRGVMFYGPPGNGKTVSIKALMHTLLLAEPPIPTLYVKSAPNTFDISNVFRQARTLSPCMLILEDVETIVTATNRSYFFNEMDGLAGNDGLFIVASTNYLERLDPGLTSRPSRFDRKYLFPLPNQHERELYCEYWRRKLQGGDADVEFPRKLCPAMASITKNFSFAFLQECFVASLLVIANGGKHGKGRQFGDAADDLEGYKLWRIFKAQADVLRREIHDEQVSGTSFNTKYRGSHDGLAAPWDDLYRPPGGSVIDVGGSSDPYKGSANLYPELGFAARKLKVLNQTAFEYRAP